MVHRLHNYYIIEVKGEIIYKYANVEIKKEIDKEICDSILNFLEELTP